MSLTKEDLQQFRGVVKQEIGQAIDTKIKPMIQEEIEGLAIMTNHGFEAVIKDIADVKIDIADIKIDIADHDFKMTELVPKVQHFHLEQRVRRLEEKAGIRREK